MIRENKTASPSVPGPFNDLPEGLQRKPSLETIEAYRLLYEKSIRDPVGFWGDLASHLHWHEKWHQVLDHDFNHPEVHWFKGGKLNASYNCLDRHLSTWRSNKVALIWQGELPEENRSFTYQQLHDHVCKFANVLKKLGAKKGDRVSLHLPMIPELPIAMLACARIGAVHSVVFTGFGHKALGDRINDAGSKLLVTTDGYTRAGRKVQNKIVVDEALKECPGVENVILVKRTGRDVPFAKGRDRWWHEEMAREDIAPDCDPAVMDAEDAFFLLSASGSKGDPRGILHTTGGYLLYVCQTMKWLFNLKDEDVYFCTEHISGMTGHSEVIYGPLVLGATTVMYEGDFTYPNPGRLFDIIERFHVTVFCTAPDVVRAWMQEREDRVNKRSISSLRLLGSSGGIPLNNEEWEWYHRHIGQNVCPVVGSWSQPETGGALMVMMPLTLQPGSVTLPLPGILPKILREDGTECDADEPGFLVFVNPWPAMSRGFWNDSGHERFKETYFKLFPGYYFAGEAAKRDSNGYFHLMGRIDDVIHLSNNRIGMAEVEGALLSHPFVAETAVVGIPHHRKGKKSYALVTLKTGAEGSELLREELLAHTRKAMGPIATPDRLHFAEVLPTAGGRRTIKPLLRKIAEERIEHLGDDSAELDSLFYHPGHTWLSVEKADEVRVGIDSFLGEVIGQVKVIILPSPGKRYVQGENLCFLVQEEGFLRIVLPVTGIILSINHKLMKQPELITEDPFGEGFLLTLKSGDFQQARKGLFSGETALSWHQEERERFKTLLVSKLRAEQEPSGYTPVTGKRFDVTLNGDPKSVGRTLQDGEIDIGEIRKSIGPERFFRWVNAFLRRGESEFWRP